MTKMTNKQQVVVICILLAGICYVSFAFECIPAAGYESCACYVEGVNNTREYINLLPLKGNSSTPRFTAKGPKEWYYSYSPCAEFSEFVGENSTGYVPCVNTSVARWTNLSTHGCYGLGDEASGTFKSATIGDFIKSNLTLNFETKEKEHRAAVISLICNDSMPHNETVFQYVDKQDEQMNTYYLSLTSKCCCPGKCGVPPAPVYSTATTPTASKQSDDKGLKTWQIILIAVGAVVLLLIILGLVFCCKKRAGYQAV